MLLETTLDHLLAIAALVAPLSVPNSDLPTISLAAQHTGFAVVVATDALVTAERIYTDGGELRRIYLPRAFLLARAALCRELAAILSHAASLDTFPGQFAVLSPAALAKNVPAKFSIPSSSIVSHNGEVVSSSRPPSSPLEQAVSEALTDCVDVDREPVGSLKGPALRSLGEVSTDTILAAIQTSLATMRVSQHQPLFELESGNPQNVPPTFGSSEIAANLQPRAGHLAVDSPSAVDAKGHRRIRSLNFNFNFANASPAPVHVVPISPAPVVSVVAVIDSTAKRSNSINDRGSLPSSHFPSISSNPTSASILKPMTPTSPKKVQSAPPRHVLWPFPARLSAFLDITLARTYFILSLVQIKFTHQRTGMCTS